MLNKIINFSLQNRILILIITGTLFISGIYVTINSDIDIFPDLNAPTVTIMTEAPGFAAEDIEKSVSYPIETAVNGATNVRRVRSSSAAGFSVVWVEFDWGTDIYKARQIVSEKLSAVNEVMPEGVGNPVLGPQSSILGEVMIIGLTSEKTSMLELRNMADKLIRPRLLSVGGVSQVTVIGGDIKEYQINIIPEKMRYFNVTLNEVLAATKQMNQNANGGVLYEYGNEYLVKGELSTNSIDDLRTVVVKNNDGTPILLSDIADVNIGSKAPKLGVASVKAKPAVLMTITKQPSVNTIDLTENVTTEIADITKNLPKDVVVSTDIFKQSDFIEGSISNIQKALLEGSIFVAIVLFVFLMNFRTTLISLIAMPLSILISILTLHALGLTINTMSLGGLAIAIGSLVDDAIVDVENVFKRLHYNRSLPESDQLKTIDVVYQASCEVRMPIFNSSLIIIASFLPLFFLQGMEGRLLIPLGISFIIALIASTIVALTLTPVLCSMLLDRKSNKKTDKESVVSQKLKASYNRALIWSIKNKRSVLYCVATLFIISLALFFTMGRSFLPSFNEGSFTINVSTLPGVSLAESERIGTRAEQLLLEVPEIKTVARKTGRAELDEHALGVNVSEIEAPYEIKDRPKKEILKEIRLKLKSIPGTNIEIGQPISHRIDAMLSGTKSQIAIKLFGDDLDQLYNLGSIIKNQISSIDGIVDANIEQQIDRPELIIRPNRNMLAKYGISLADFSQFINVALGGNVVSQVYEGGFPYDLTLRLSNDDRDSIDKIKDISIDSNEGSIPLSTIADVVSSSGPNNINRENVNRRIVISANVENGDLRGTVNKIKDSIHKNVKLPEGYYVTYGGQFESEETASRILSLTSILAIIIIFFLLWKQFKNITQSVIILLNLPLAMIGGIIILKLSGGEVNIPAIIGFISLLGITTRNGMLLISHYNLLANEGKSVYERTINGSMNRLNPIIMTALTSALALIPLAVNGDLPGNEIQSPLAIVILGGLVSSTILNIFVVPIVYYLTNIKTEK